MPAVLMRLADDGALSIAPRSASCLTPVILLSAKTV